MKRRLLLLLTVPLGVWLVAAYPVHRLGGDEALVHSATAAALCLLPTSLTLVWSAWAERQSSDQQVMAMLGGTGVRLFTVVGLGLVLHLAVPYFAGQRFLVWLLVYYLLTLALEMALLVAGRPVPGGPGDS